MKAILAFTFLLGVAGLSSCAQLVYNAKKVETPMCTTCLQTVALAKARLDSSAKQSELRSILDTICQQLPVSVQSTCTQFVAMKYDKMVEFVLHHDAATVCNHFSQCESTSSSQSSNSDLLSLIKSLSKQNVGADECATCKKFFAVFENYVTSPTFVDTVIKFVTTDVCPRLAPEFPGCGDFAARYVPMIFSLLQQVSPDAVCGFLGLCGSQTSGIAMSLNHVEKPSKLAVQDDCADCQAFMGDLQQRFSDPNQQQQVADLVANQLCPMLGSVFPQCASYAEEYVPIALQMFEGLATSSICQGLSWCTSSSKRSASKLFHDFAKLVNGAPRGASASSGPTNGQCSDCEAFVTDAQKRYADPAQQQVIIDLIVNQACPFLSNVFSQCAAYAQEYIPIGFQYLAGYSPQQVCQAVAFCSSATEKVIKPLALLPSVKVSAPSRLGDSCNDCTQFVADAQHFYSDPQNQQQVSDLVSNSLCPLISSFFPDCAQFAQAEIPQLFNLLVSTDPSVICNYIGLCATFRPARRFASGTHRFEIKSRTPKAKIGDDQYCSDCQVFFTDLQQYLNDPNNQQYITNELVNQVCPLVSQQFPQCTQLLTEYLPFAFSAFESVSASMICTQLNFCSSTFFTTLRNSVPKRPQLQDSTLCSDCRLVVEVLSGVLQSNDTINELVATVTKVCSIVAEAGRPMCTAMLGAALRELIYTFQHSTDDQVCATFFAQCAQTQHINEQIHS